MVGNVVSDMDNTLESIVAHAIDSRASDIHIEPGKIDIKIRFRIDGLLQQYKTINKFYQDQLIMKIKVSSKMNTTDHRLPQDGHLNFSYKNISYNIRISSLPSLNGETIVMRILNREDMLMKLESLGMEHHQVELVKRIIASPSGMVLITGPTGSGKSNFLYSILQTLNSPDRNIITLEDPIEYEIPEITQCQINEGIDFSFASAMRSVVRQDPDIVMLGEIRDALTAQLAIQASLIGKLVFSTFHTFDIPALITRFFEMGITSSIVAQSIEAVISTRLIRQICTQCKTEYTPTSADLERLAGLTIEKLYKGKGCELCKNSGYYGRTGIFEIVYFDSEFKTTIVEKKTASFLYELIKKKRTKTLLDCAFTKVIEGVTTLEEVDRILGTVI